MSVTVGPKIAVMSGAVQGDLYTDQGNSLLRMLQALVQPNVLSVGLTTPPSSPIDGNTYIVGVGAAGVWSGKDNHGSAVGLEIVVRARDATTGIIIDEQGTGAFPHEALQILTPTGFGSQIDVGLLDSTLLNEFGFLVQLSNNSRTKAQAFAGTLISTATKGTVFLATDNISNPDDGNWGFYQGGTSNNARNNFDAPVRYKPNTFAGLPLPSASTKGMVACITDSNTNVWGATVAGGGGNSVLVFCNGSAWTVVGK